MFPIAAKKRLNDEVVQVDVVAPAIAAKARAGQFVIVRCGEDGERIPLTIAGHDEAKGQITLIFQIVGKTTADLAALTVGDDISDVVGPLGVATDLKGVEKVCVIGGGLGAAIAYPQAKAFFDGGADVDVICGFRRSDLAILKAELAAVSHRYFLCTDDGSEGFHGFVSDQLQQLLNGGDSYDLVYAVGPLPMMKAVCAVTAEAGIKTVVSMNPIMLDGTGMCGACRLTVGGERKFACVDGPDFDGHQVDFDEAIARNAYYREEEKQALAAHQCRLLGGDHR